MTGRSQWNLWLGHGIPLWRRKCEVCGTRWLVFRYTNGELSVWACRRHKYVVPGQDFPR